jgi:hypothetical protein
MHVTSGECELLHSGDKFYGFEEVATPCDFGHWIWYIFPQIQGLGQSALSRDAITVAFAVQLRDLVSDDPRSPAAVPCASPFRLNSGASVTLPRWKGSVRAQPFLPVSLGLLTIWPSPHLRQGRRAWQPRQHQPHVHCRPFPFPRHRNAALVLSARASHGQAQRI